MSPVVGEINGWCNYLCNLPKKLSISDLAEYKILLKANVVEVD